MKYNNELKSVVLTQKSGEAHRPAPPFYSTPLKISAICALLELRGLHNRNFTYDNDKMPLQFVLEYPKKLNPTGNWEIEFSTGYRMNSFLQ